MALKIKVEYFLKNSTIPNKYATQVDQADKLIVSYLHTDLSKGTTEAPPTVLI